MDSRLDALFRTTFQPAQQTDTWQGIRREEPQGEHSKKNTYKHQDEKLEEEDHATLSVMALHEFLKNLLIQAGEKMAWNVEQTMPPEDTDQAITAPLRSASATAARAYQTTARAVAGQSIDFSERPINTQTPSGPSITLSADELRTIHQLIQDIEDLGRRGISSIPLLPAETFLQSLELGVRAVSGA